MNTENIHAACAELVRRLLNPEQFGRAVTAEVRDAARIALGRAPVEQAQYLNTAVLPDRHLDFHIDAVLRAAGSGLRHYSMQKTLDDMRTAMRTALLSAAPVALPNDGSQPEDTAHLNCPHCQGSGHIGDVAPAAEARHIDDIAVEEFAAAMAKKMAEARVKGRSGWQECDPVQLSQMLREHVEKGDPRDVANFCMMLWHHEAAISAAESKPVAADGWQLVPKIPTTAMCRAGLAERHDDLAKSIYAAMLAAAPQQPAPAQCDHIYHAISLVSGSASAPVIPKCAKCGFMPSAQQPAPADWADALLVDVLDFLKKMQGHNFFERGLANELVESIEAAMALQAEKQT